ncbi:Tctex-1 family-domain-containing protein [Pavlovales sp. CCMP2436]|nr:Tctex-1 family-domain-containing protein [Pavlovales sp. CCMP2436]|mmetsp:Transcript_10986/g.27731  ORF Transcript_10986/g.27731 Transcript_10986/m.27731 type:complete len:143 (-) Transcript_10986:256-684(-)|eukprot:CAMPEP_0179884358 /NCGR_PEP_ID=MMETSP0982-20121206/29487_1 /TAXON_ID=483367 /ORGANISM="non described non described, Strain CCMP 2436" /LENGTH=142 /DNA_ID=CAMNT_0021779431 /DNA_START=53 /DNA_END=481 /DNA_ORIENTATION=-
MDYGQQDPVKVYENTYQMGPRDEQKVSIPRVQEAIRRVLEEKMAVTLEKETGKKDKHVWNYDHEEVGELAREACEAIQQSVKELSYNRYKLLVQVQMGENNGQALRTASRCLWAPETDVSVSGSFVKGRMFATATVFCLYHE